MLTDEYDPHASFLVRQASSGDEEAFSRLFDLYFDRIRAFAYRITLNYEMAEDVAQESFIRAARHMDGLRDGKAFEAWIFRICGNMAKDHLRSAAAYASRLRSTREMAAESAPGSSSDHVSEKVHHALNTLSPDQRQAVALVFFENFSHAEAAKRVGCAESTISWRIFLAKKTLRKCLTV